MEFIYKPKRIIASDDQLLNSLRDAAEANSGTYLTAREFSKEHGTCTVQTICSRFGTWNRALVAAGLKTSNTFYHSVQALFENLADVWTKLEKQPSQGDMKKPLSKVPFVTYRRRFGSWTSTMFHFNAWIHSKNKDAFEDFFSVKFRQSRDVRKGLRYKILERDNSTCKMCGASPRKDPEVTLHIDHIIPSSKGGDSSPENLQTLCQACNLGKFNH